MTKSLLIVTLVDTFAVGGDDCLALPAHHDALLLVGDCLEKDLLAADGLEYLDDVNLSTEATDTVHKQSIVSVFLWLFFPDATGAPTLCQVAYEAVEHAVVVTEEELIHDSPSAHDFIVRYSVFSNMAQDMEHICMGHVLFLDFFLKRVVVASLIFVAESDLLEMVYIVGIVILIDSLLLYYIVLLICTILLDHEEFSHDLVEVVS